MVAFGFLLSVFLWGQAALAGPTAPGSESDPLVTESWVRAYFSGGGGGNDLQLLEERLQKLEAAEINRALLEEPSPSAAVFEIVTVAAGEKLLAGAGTEMILRSGRARALAGPGGGLSDLTAGCNLTSGAPIKADHLLLSSRDDGRGAIMDSQAIFLVRGGYTAE